MVFWKQYPIRNIIQEKINTDKFKSLIFEKSTLKSPTDYEVEIINKNNQLVIKEVAQFIKENFGSPPKTPILDIPEDKLIQEKDHILFVRDITQAIVGCIRYHYIGTFINTNKEIYCEDCFCIHPSWRKKGLGDYLLTHLHIYLNTNNIPYSIFLKEGSNLSIIHKPFYSSTYVFRQSIPSKSNNILSLSINKAYKILDIFYKLNPNLFIIRDKDNQNQFWRLYSKSSQKVLACIQDTYQQFEENNKIKKIGWITAWIESPNMTDSFREEASKEISDSVHEIFDYIWTNKAHVGKSNLWKDDGPFHWYLYQWTTSLKLNNSYCLLN